MNVIPSKICMQILGILLVWVLHQHTIHYLGLTRLGLSVSDATVLTLLGPKLQVQLANQRTGRRRSHRGSEHLGGLVQMYVYQQSFLTLALKSLFLHDIRIQLR